MGAENLATTGIRSPGLLSLSESLYQLSFPGAPQIREYSVSVEPGHNIVSPVVQRSSQGNMQETLSPSVRMPSCNMT
jgi:hypothetical protein